MRRGRGEDRRKKRGGRKRGLTEEAGRELILGKKNLEHHWEGEDKNARNYKRERVGGRRREKRW